MSVAGCRGTTAGTPPMANGLALDVDVSAVRVVRRCDPGVGLCCTQKGGGTVGLGDDLQKVALRFCSEVVDALLLFIGHVVPPCRVLRTSHGRGEGAGHGVS